MKFLAERVPPPLIPTYDPLCIKGLSCGIFLFLYIYFVLFLLQSIVLFAIMTFEL
jgi:hypothetical protein